MASLTSQAKRFSVSLMRDFFLLLLFLFNRYLGPLSLLVAMSKCVCVRLFVHSPQLLTKPIIKLKTTQHRHITNDILLLGSSSSFVSFSQSIELDGIAPLIADPSWCNSTKRQNPSFSKMAVSFEPVMQF